MARVSRLIGKSDTTGKRLRWQVDFSVSVSPGPGHLNQTGIEKAQTQETPLRLEWRFSVLRWSLASQKSEDGGCPPRLLQAFRPVSPMKGPLLWRLLLPGPAVLGLAGILSSSRYITGA